MYFQWRDNNIIHQGLSFILRHFTKCLHWLDLLEQQSESSMGFEPMMAGFKEEIDPSTLKGFTN